MRLKRYKMLGKKKFARLLVDYDSAKGLFDAAAANLTKSDALVCVKPKKSDFYKFCYKVDNKNLYEDYLLFVNIAEDDEGAKVEYRFVFDNLMFWYTKILSILCIVVPILTAIFAKFSFGKANLLVYIPLAIIALFGIIALFLYNEDKEKAEGILETFENFLVDTFND